MREFTDELRLVARELDLPQPARVRVIAELRADLADLAEVLEIGGTTPAEARRRAVEALVPDSEALTQLRSIHRPLYHRLVDRFSDPIRHRVERFLFGVALLGLAGAGAAALRSFDLTRDPARLTYPLVGLGLAAAGIAVWKLFEVYVVKAHDRARLRRGLDLLPIISVAAAVGCLLGLTVDLYQVAGQIGATSADQQAILRAWLRRDAAMASLGLLVGALSLGSWLWLAAGVARVEQAELELEFELGPQPQGGNQ